MVMWVNELSSQKLDSLRLQAVVGFLDQKSIEYTEQVV